MSIDIKKLYNDFKIDWISSGPQTTKNWINTQCPFCSDTKYHLGYNPKINKFSCWRCGTKNTNQAISTILNKPYNVIKDILGRYYIASIYESTKHINNVNKVFLPNETNALYKEHKKYLMSRRLNWKTIEKDWRIKGTANTGRYKNRIIIPIYHNNKLVSYHSRDITDKSKIKAKACQIEKEIIHHKHLLYGFDNVEGNSVIVVEGPFDVWKMGFGSVATFGIKFTEEQIELLSCFKNIFIMFDNEKDAQIQAQKLANKISIFSNTYIINDYPIGANDPCDLYKHEILKIKQKIKSIIN